MSRTFKLLAHSQFHAARRLSSTESRGENHHRVTERTERIHREISNSRAGYQAGVVIQRIDPVSETPRKKTSVKPSVHSVPLWFFGRHKALCDVSSTEVGRAIFVQNSEIPGRMPGPPSG